MPPDRQRPIGAVPTSEGDTIPVIEWNALRAGDRVLVHEERVPSERRSGTAAMVHMRYSSDGIGIRIAGPVVPPLGVN